MNKNKIYTYLLFCLTAYNCIASESEEEEADLALISVRNHSPQPEQQPPILLSPHLSGGHDQTESWIDEYIKNFQQDEEAIFGVDAFFKNQPSEETTVIGGASVGPSNFIKTPETLWHPNSYFEGEGGLEINGKVESFMNSIIVPTTPPDFFLPKMSRVVDTPNDHFFALQIPEIPTDEPQTFNLLEEEANSFKSYKIKSLKCQFKTCECKNEFESSELLKKHIQEQHADVKRICTYCGKSFAQLGGLKMHTQTHTDEKPFPCGTCGKSFPDSSSLKRHQTSKNGCRLQLFRNFIAGITNASIVASSYQSDSSNKEDVHDSDETENDASEPSRKRVAIEAPESESEFTIAASGGTSAVNNEPYKIKDLFCQFKTCECKNEFESSELLKEHIQEKHSQFENVCEICGLKLNYASALKMHKRTHTGGKPFKCTIDKCDKSFAQLGNLTRHILTHTDNSEIRKRKELIKMRMSHQTK